jgi:kynureninase
MLSARLSVLLLALLPHLAVHASPTTDALGRCLSDNTTGKDRKDLATWVFVAMSAHPEIGPIAKASAEAIDVAQRTAGTIFTRLIAEACPNEMRAVVKSDGTEGIKVSFEFLGSMAMQELMSNAQVSRAIGGFERYVDKSRVEQILK